MTTPEKTIKISIINQELNEFVEKIRQHERSLEAIRHMTRRALQIFEKFPLFNYVTGNESSQFACLYINYIHYWRDENDPYSGIIASNVRNFCLDRGLMGPKRVFAMMNVLRIAGLIVPDDAVGDARVTRYKPTDRAAALLRPMMEGFAEAAEMLEQGGDFRKHIDAYPGATLAILAHTFRDYYLDLGPILNRISILQPFISKNNAYKIILRAYASEDHRNIGAAGYNYIAGLFSTSRLHVSRILREAEDRGLLKILSKGGHQIEISKQLSESLDHVGSIQLAMHILGHRKAFSVRR